MQEGNPRAGGVAARMPHVFVLICVHNGLAHTLKCLDSLLEQDYPHLSIILCDDGSSDGTSSTLSARYPHVHLEHGDGNLWWAGATNKCVMRALRVGGDSDVCITLNNDVTVPREYISYLLNLHQANPRALIGSVAVDYRDGARLVAGEPRLSWLTAKKSYKNVIGEYISAEKDDLVTAPKLSGKGTLIPLIAFREVGLYDAERFPQYAADDDFSLRAKSHGYTLLLSYGARVSNDYENTGLGSGFRVPNLREFLASLISIKSPNNLLIRWRFILRHCPRLLVPSHLLLDTGRLFGSFCIRYLKHRLRLLRGG